MAKYKIYLRSFASWREFGELVQSHTVFVPVPLPPAPGYPLPPTVPITFGGSYHGDSRGFSLDTAVTARVSTVMELDLQTGTLSPNARAWCDASIGPSEFIGPTSVAKGSAKAKFTATRNGPNPTAIVEYSAANPLVTLSPTIDARGEFAIVAASGTLTIDALITGDQFPACEGFIEDPKGNKVFLGGFAPNNKKQILRLYGGMNRPKEVWFESHLIVSIEADGSFKSVTGGGSGSNATSPVCEELSLTLFEWNARAMGAIPMPSDAP